MTLAIIGTAGRDKTKPMTRALWDWMLSHALATVPKGALLVSGGAAWADHLAVALFLMDHTKDLTLHFPAPFDRQKQEFSGPMQSSASAANWYHAQFSHQVYAGDYDSVEQIEEALQRGAKFTEQKLHSGYSGMFARNLLVADCDDLIAYTFGEGNEPADGGTKDTWDKSRAQFKLHIRLSHLT